jgi:hypothetical protein
MILLGGMQPLDKIRVRTLYIRGEAGGSRRAEAEPGWFGVESASGGRQAEPWAAQRGIL